MELSIRLKAVADCVLPGLRPADIGTDHGFLPIWLVQNGRCPHMIACDVRTGPLSRAQEHIQLAGLSGRIETRLSDGFEGLQPGEVDGAILAGMGGMLMADILQAESQRERNLLQEVKQLILQPQSDLAAVRRMVHKLSFRIERETMVIDRDKYYWIFDCRPGRQRFEKAWQYQYGQSLAERKDPVFQSYLREQEARSRRLLAALEKESSESAYKRREELLQTLREIQEVRDHGNDGSTDC